MKKALICLLAAAVLLGGIALGGLYFWQQMHRSYTAEELGIEVLHSQADADMDGVDDFTDLMLSARAYIKTKPVYKSVYYAGGYPDDEHGVCTDVVWQAFAGAGYTLKDMVDEDIAAHLECYPDADPDPNIDFRRVVNLHVFFDRYAEELTCSFDDPAQWQAGDIVIIDGHIGICSDRRNAAGIPYLIHHTGQGVREANDIPRYDAKGMLLAHYRWTA